MAEDLAPPPTRRRRIGAAFAGLGIYVLVSATAYWLPSAIGDYSFLIGVVAGILVAGGLTPALTVRDWVKAGLATFGLIMAFGVAVVLWLLLTWPPDVLG